eukprot:gene7111-11274_t
MNSNKLQILNRFKNILRQTKYVQNEKQKKDLYEKAIAEFSKNETLSFEEIISKCDKHLSFLKLMTPKIPTNSKQKIFIIKDGKVEEVNEIIRDNNGKAISNFGMGNIDPDQLRKHEYLLKRQRFETGPLKDYPKQMYGINNKD